MYRFMWAALFVVGGIFYFERTGGRDGMLTFASAPAGGTHSASFAICREGSRVNCVVDGDTFWFRGEKIRIPDIHTPELSPPRCTAERVEGEAAKARLTALLNTGPFSMSAGTAKRAGMVASSELSSEKGNHLAIFWWAKVWHIGGTVDAEAGAIADRTRPLDITVRRHGRPCEMDRDPNGPKPLERVRYACA